MSLNWEKACEAGACVEMAPVWEKSNASAETDSVEVGLTDLSRCEGGDCVETAISPQGVAVRDGKLGEDSPVLRFTVEEWRAFRLGVLDGQFAYDEQHAQAAR